MSTSEIKVEHILDDRDEIQNGEAVLLIVEDDPNYACANCDLATGAREVEGEGGHVSAEVFHVED